MSGIIQSIAQAFTQDLERAKHTAKRDSALIALAGVFGLTAYAAGIVAAAIYASETYGPVASATIVGLSAILAMLVVIAVLKFLHLQDRREARRAEARTRLVSTLGTALLPLVLKSRATGNLAVIGGVALLANELLKTSSRPADPTAGTTAARPGISTAHSRRVNGVINPHIHSQQQESIR